MPGAKKNTAAAASGALAARPYTDPGDGRRHGGKNNRMTSAETEAILALDRKITDGLNLVHEQFGVLRQERLEDRREFREFRNEIRQEIKDSREEYQQGFTALREEFQQGFATLREEQQRESTALREELQQGFTALREEQQKESTALRDLSAQVGILLERSRGTRRLVWGVLGTLGLLVAGGVLRPVFDRAVAALFGG